MMGEGKQRKCAFEGVGVERGEEGGEGRRGIVIGEERQGEC